jgi:ATP-dependent DNA helicase
MPDIFDDLETFQQWLVAHMRGYDLSFVLEPSSIKIHRFDFQDMSVEKPGLLPQGEIVTQLHNILKPFLLRRLKTEVEQNLPPKKEYLLYAPLTQQQNDIYKAIVNQEIRDYLVAKKVGDSVTPQDNQVEVETEDDEDGPRTSRRLAKRPRFDYSKDSDDKDFLEGILSGDISRVNMVAPKVEKTAKQLGQEWAVKSASKSRVSISASGRRTDTCTFIAKTVNNMRLQNMIMQLRKVRSSEHFRKTVRPITEMLL